MERLEYGIVEIWNDQILKGDGYYRAVRYRSNNLPESCPHKHRSRAEAEKCREFPKDK